MALSVTRHEENPKGKGDVSGWTVLSQGFDTLDVGVGVRWGIDWETLREELEKGRSAASGKDSQEWKEIGGERYWIVAGGKGKNYRFHLFSNIGHIFIAKSGGPKKRTPNVYVSFSAFNLWRIGIRGCVQKLGELIRSLGGRIAYMKPSRCDLCVDLKIPDGLSLAFLTDHMVSHAKKTRNYLSGERLETFYLGDGISPVQLRIYHKGAKAIDDQSYFWLCDIWKTQEIGDVWRIEFQLRREILKAYGINHIGELIAKAGALWTYLTEDWCSLRLPDNDRTARRSVHPDWKTIQACAGEFGKAVSLQKCEGPIEPADATWYVDHIAGCAIGFGALRGFSDMESTWQELGKAVKAKKTVEEFRSALAAKRLLKGFGSAPIKGSYPGEWDTP